jgi:hypothetical protein
MKRVLKELGLKRIIYPCINIFPMKRVLKGLSATYGYKQYLEFPMKRVLKGHGRRSRQSGNNYWISLNGC